MEKSKNRWTVDLDPTMAGDVENTRQKAGLAESKSAVLERLIRRGLITLELESANKQRKESPHV